MMMVMVMMIGEGVGEGGDNTDDIEYKICAFKKINKQKLWNLFLPYLIDDWKWNERTLTPLILL